MDNDDIYKINLGGFPPISKINITVKKKREFDKEVIKITSSKLLSFDILNINNIINKK